MLPMMMSPPSSDRLASVKPASASPTYYLLSRREKYVWGLKPSPWQRHTFKALCQELGIPVPNGLSHQPPDLSHHASMVDDCRSDDNSLCHDMLTTLGFTHEQMHRAAERFRLGRSRSGQPIYWMIDDMGRCLDGHIGDAWVSAMLKARCPELAPYLTVTHCLFGLHQTSLNDAKAIGIVESERSAVLLSELCPELLWLAYAYPTNMTIDQFEALQGRQVTFYPRTDPTKDIYVSFLEMADQVRRAYRSIDISVSPFLEDNATDSQKQRHIDLVDYLFDTL